MPRLSTYAMQRQHGGMLSLLLTLLAIGAIGYFALKSRSGGHSDTGTALGCEPRIAALVRDTGGVGAQAQAAYDALPAECRKLLPNPAALAPTPEPAPDN